MTGNKDARTCGVCGGALRRSNTVGVCQRTNECRNVAARRHRSAVKSERPFCEICGGLLRRDSTTGVCTRNAECQSEHRRRMYAATKMTEQPVCEICGGPVRSSNSVGVCKANPACKAEAQRRRYAASDASRRANARQWRREHREQHLANKARYRKNNRERQGERPEDPGEERGHAQRRDPGPLHPNLDLCPLQRPRPGAVHRPDGRGVVAPTLAPSAGGGCLAAGDRLYQANRPSAFQGRRTGSSRP